LSITLDTNLYLICSMFNISSKKIADEYSGMSLEKIMEAEAAQGNTAAASFDSEVLNNPAKLIEIFGLNKLGNKYAILNNLSEHDLENLLPLLEQQDMVAGLKMFDKDKILELVQKLPKAQLVKYIFQMFSPEKVLKLMPEEFIDKFLMSKDLDKDMVMKHLKSFPPEILAQMVETATGQPVTSMDPRDLMKQMQSLSPLQYKDALLSIPEDKKRELILGMTKENPKLFELFEAEGYAKIAAKKDKPDLIKAAQVIEPEELVKMLKELPKDLIAVVMTQIDPKVFADILIEDYQDILGQVIAG